MAKIIELIGRIASQNSGEIVDCYSLMRLKLKHKSVAGLVAENIGQVSRSFYGTSEIKSAEDAKRNGFDTENIWEYIGNQKVLRFIPEKWLFDVTQSPLYQEIESQTVEISTADELLDFTKKINGGDRSIAFSHIKVCKDIDLGGKEWIPIGCELTKAFCGIFDGGGHTIHNFVINPGEHIVQGFFGYLKGEVINLTVDCQIRNKNGSIAGGIAAYCEGGVIACCASIVDAKYQGKNFGGIVGINTGRVFRSYSAGLLSSIFFPWRYLAAVLVLLITGFAWTVLMNQPEEMTVFAPVPHDVRVRPIPDAMIDPREGSNFVSVQLNQIVNVSLTTGECQLNFRNPGQSNHSVVVQLHLDDTIIAESGAVPPGYILDSLRLTTMPDSATLLPGEFGATAFLVFYDINTHNRAMVESQFPVVLVVED